MIKLALVTESRPGDMAERFANPSGYGTFDCSEDLIVPLLADLQAMAAEG